MDADLSLRSKALVMPILDESRPSPAINISDTLHWLGWARRLLVAKTDDRVLASRAPGGDDAEEQTHGD
jgi:hypothetical protein